MKRPTLYYLGTPEDGFGWGVANTNLVRALRNYCDVVPDTSGTRFDHPVFVPIADHHLRPLRKVRSPRVIGYAFTELPLPDGAHRTARQYDVLFAGSTWCAQRLIDAGCRNVHVLIQGIDHNRFKPHVGQASSLSSPRPFVVFSGGKFEFRKGQDLVIAALRVFMSHRKDTVLIAAWHNPWPASISTMQNSWLIDLADPFAGLPPAPRVIELPPLRNDQMPEIYAKTDIGLFPNRCEAGNNMVMCEYMACARPVIATYATGHLDVFNVGQASSLSPYLLTTGTYDPAGWFNPEVCDIIAHLEHAYTHREDLAARGQACADLVKPLDWNSCAAQVFAAAFPDHASPLPALASELSPVTVPEPAQ